MPDNNDELQSCASCQFWHQQPDNIRRRWFKRTTRESTWGWCKRYPRTIHADGKSYFPTTHVTDWCGEYKFEDEPDDKEKEDYPQSLRLVS